MSTGFLRRLSRGALDALLLSPFSWGFQLTSNIIVLAARVDKRPVQSVVSSPLRREDVG